MFEAVVRCMGVVPQIVGVDNGCARVARRGLTNVLAELLDKVLAYNFCRMASLRSPHHAEQRTA